MKFSEYLKESENKFVIPEKLKKNIQITNDINDSKNWKAKVILGNNGGKKGIMDEVGYIAVSPTSNIIIPIARHDEHQNGYELLDHLIRTKIIPDDDYHTIWRGQNFIYGSQDRKYIEKAIKSYKKWLELGGRDLPLRGVNTINYTGTLTDFMKRVKDINMDGDVVLNLDTIFIRGQNLIKDLTELALQNKKLSDNSQISHGKEKQITNFIKKVAVMIEELDSYGEKYPERLFDSTSRKRWHEEITKAEAENNLQKASEIVFGMNGIKNIVHMSLKAILKGSKKMPEGAWYDGSYYKEGFGNVKKAKEEFDKMSSI